MRKGDKAALKNRAAMYELALDVTNLRNGIAKYEFWFCKGHGSFVIGSALGFRNATDWLEGFIQGRSVSNILGNSH